MRKIAAAWLLLMLGAATALACLWDVDTVAMELKGFPEVSDAVVGRLKINPPLYYEVRLQRVSHLVKSKPDDLGLYDDAAVACDKLGRSDEAIDWMKKKSERLAVSTLPTNSIKDHRYRYHANLGTFYTHKWIKQENKANTELLRKGIAELEEAVRINSDAHFGREIVQIEILKKLNSKFAKHATFDGSSIESDWMKFLKEVGLKKVQKGIIGIMLMGSGAESPDMLYLLGLSLTDHRLGGQYTRYILAQRITELTASGKKCLLMPANSQHVDASTEAKNGSFLKLYDTLIKNGREFQANRINYMLARLEKGMHPDTDPDFWKDYKEAPTIVYDHAAAARKEEEAVLRYVRPAILIFAVTVLGIWLVVRRRLLKQGEL